MKYIFLLILLLLALFYDVRHCRVPNVLILIGYAIGTFNLCFQHGVAGILISLISIAIVWLVFSPVYFIKGLGGGDCKLLAWLPLFIGWDWLLECYFLIFVCAGIGGIFNMIIRKQRYFRFAIAAFLGALFSILIHVVL